MNAPHRDAGFFTESLSSRDPALFAAITDELGRQRDEIELIASENIVSSAVMEAQGSVMTNKYAEGYPGRRYYGGCQFVDVAENLAIERACALFGCGLRQRAAEFRQPGQPGRVPGADQARRHHSGDEPGRGRASDAWRGAEPVGQMVQRGAIRGAPGHAAARLRPDRGAGAGAQAGDDHRGRLCHSARASTSPGCARSRTRWAPGCWSTWRISRGWWRPGFTPARSPMRMWQRRRRTRRCAARAAA